MSLGRRTLLSLSAAVMEMCWLYGWAVFLMSALLRRPFPLAEAVAAFVFGAGVTRLTTGRGYRVAAVLAIQTGLCAPVVLYTLHGVHFSSYPLAGSLWLSDLVYGSRGLLGWTGVVMTFIWSLLFWIGGVTLAKRPKTYYAFCSRLDVGLAAFFCLFLTKMALAVKGGIRVDDPVTATLLFPFFLFALIALGVTRIGGHGVKGFLPGREGLGVVLIFASSAILIIGSMAFLLMSYLTAAARTAHIVLQNAAHSSTPFVEAVLRFIFQRGNIPRETGVPKGRSSAWDLGGPAKTAWWMDMVEKVIGWGMWGLFGALLAGIVALASYFIIRWLLSRTGRVRPAARPGKRLAAWILRLWRFMRRAAGALLPAGRRASDGRRAYGALLDWARVSRLSPAGGETPLEFGGRLRRHFPHLVPEIRAVVDTYNREIYGAQHPGGRGDRGLTKALTRLRNPLYWPLRLKVRYVFRK